MMVVVPYPALVTGGVAGRLDPAGEAGIDECGEDIVESLPGERPRLTRPGEQVFGGRVGAVPEEGQHHDARGRHPHVGAQEIVPGRLELCLYHVPL